MGQRASAGVGKVVTRSAPPARSERGLSRRRHARASEKFDADARGRAPVSLCIVGRERGADRQPVRGQREVHGTRRDQAMLERRLVAIVIVLAILLAAAAITFSLSGCAGTFTPAPRPVMVNIPVAAPVYCKVPPLAHPALPVAGLSADSPPANTIRSYAATVAILKAAVVQRDRVLAGCAAPAAAPTTASADAPGVASVDAHDAGLAAAPPVESAAASTGASAAAPAGLQDAQNADANSITSKLAAIQFQWKRWRPW